MELLATLALLYVWQCTRAVPRGSVLFVRWARRWREQPGGGRRLLNPWPSASAILGHWPLEAAVEGGAAPAPACAVADLRTRYACALRETRALGWLCDAYALWLFVLLPLLVASEGEERALFYGAAPTGLIHLLGLGLLLRAHRRLRPSARSERFEQLSVCALYPLALLRARPDLVLAVCDGFHVLAVRGLLHSRERLVESWRCEWARLESRRSTSVDTAAQRKALQAVRDELALSEAELTAARPRRDPTAARYCPACLCDYREGFGCCRDCAVTTLAYEAG